MEEKQRRNINNKRQQTNGWKWAFLTLLAVVLGIMIWLILQLSGPSPVQQQSANQEDLNQINDTATFQVTAEKKQINQLINQYLAEETHNKSVQYQFQLADQAQLAGTFRVFGVDVPFQLDLDPFVMENGNVQLKAKQISLGKLNLPIPFAMKQIGQQLALPNWVEIHHEEETIILRLDAFSLKSGIFFSADRIDLANDDIRLNVFVPNKKNSEREEETN